MICLHVHVYMQNVLKKAKIGEIDILAVVINFMEIFCPWPELQEHIKTAVKTLVQTHIAGN